MIYPLRGLMNCLLNNMLSSTKLKLLKPFIDIIESHKGETLGDIFRWLNSHKHEHFKKGASGLIIENLLGLENNNSKKQI